MLVATQEYVPSLSLLTLFTWSVGDDVPNVLDDLPIFFQDMDGEGSPEASHLMLSGDPILTETDPLGVNCTEGN